MFGCDFLHDLHRQLVMVGRDIGRRVDRRQFVLCGRHFVVLRLGKDAQLPEFLVQICHISGDSRFDDAEIVIIHLLSFRRHRAEQGPAAELQIFSLFIHFTVDQKIFLLRTDGSPHIFDIVTAEQAEDPHGLLVQGLHGAQQRRLFVERLAAVGTECGRDA